MATVNIRLRDDADSYEITPDGEGAIPVTVEGYHEDIDLDQLTPRARTLAEAVAQRSLRIAGTIWLESDQGEYRPWSGWAYYPATSTMSAITYLEREAEKIPPNWRVLGATPHTPVPSLAAAAEDRHLGKDAVLKHMDTRGAHMSPAAWDTLRRAGHLPEPDRYVSGRPQWLLETIDAYINRDRELWPISKVAEYLGYSGPSATGGARKQLSRWGVTAEGRAPGKGGESLFAADQVQAAHQHRPGRGRWAESRQS